MSSEETEGGRNETNRARNLRKRYRTQHNRREIDNETLAIMRATEIQTEAILRANEIQAERDREKQARLKQEHRIKTGFYRSRRNKFRLILNFVRPSLIALTTFAMGIGLYWLRPYLSNGGPAEQALSTVQFFWAMVVAAVLLAWLFFRAYLLWSLDYLYADANQVIRDRRAVWYFGISKIHMPVPTARALCSVTQSPLDDALSKIRISSSTVTVDTSIDKDGLLHDMKYVPHAELLAEIINDNN